MAAMVTTEISTALSALVGSGVVGGLILWLGRRWFVGVDKKLDGIAEQLSKHGEAIAAIQTRNHYRDELCRERHKGE